MDAYKTPESNLDLTQVPLFRPGKAMLIGLLITVVLYQLIANLMTLVFIIFNVTNSTNPTNFNEQATNLYNNPLFLIIDLAISFTMCFIAGYSTSKYVPNKEIQYAIILIIINFLIYISLTLFTDNDQSFPTWYIALSYLITVIAILSGSLLRKRKSGKIGHSSP